MNEEHNDDEYEKNCNTHCHEKLRICFCMASRAFLQERERERERVVGTLQSMKVKSILVISLHNGRQINKLLVR